VNDISDRALMTALGRQMTSAIARQSAAAGNLANLDTPGYRTKDVAFDDVLDDQLGRGNRLASTHPGHLPGVEGQPGSVKDVDDLLQRRDGNNVQLDRELLNMTRAAADFGAAQTAMAAKFRLVRYAITESH
jgi:flagellar basal-body rod protein FlgB